VLLKNDDQLEKTNTEEQQQRRCCHRKEFLRYTKFSNENPKFRNRSR
jgi:hypothetical protein